MMEASIDQYLAEQRERAEHEAREKEHYRDRWVIIVVPDKKQLRILYVHHYPVFHMHVVIWLLVFSGLGVSLHHEQQG